MATTGFWPVMISEITAHKIMASTMESPRYSHAFHQGIGARFTI